MHRSLALVLALAAPIAALAQTPDPATAAAAAAQRAAEAAEKAADAAARSAAAVEKLVAGKTPDSPKTTESAPTAGPAPTVAPSWTGVVGLGLIALTGNSQSLTFKGTGAFERKTEDWIYGLKAMAVYGQQTPAGSDTSVVSALAAGLQARGDRRFTQQLSAYLIAGIDTDHVKSIEERPFGEGGMSLIWFDTKEAIPGSKDAFDKTSLRTDLGFRYGREIRFNYYPTPPDVVGALPSVDIIAPHAGVAYRYAINRDVIFTQDVDAVPNLIGDTRLLLTTLSKLAARLTAAVSLGVGFGIAYDSVPAAKKKNLDTALTVGLEVGL